MKRVSSKFRPPLRAIEGKKKKKLAWVSLQGLLVGAEESTSSKAIKGDLRLEEAAAWELFTPLQRVVIVAVVAVAVADLHLNKRSQIARLRRQLEIKDQKLFSLRQKIESLKNKEDDPTEEEPDFMKDREKPILEHQLHHMKGNKRPVRQELAFMKHKIDSMQKEIDTFKDKALSHHRDPSSSSETEWGRLADEELYVREKEAAAQQTAANAGLYAREKEAAAQRTAADAALYVREKEAAAQRTAADAAFYFAQQAADAELYKKKKEAEGIKAVTEALTKTSRDDKTPPMHFKDYMMFKHGLLQQRETPNASPPNEQTVPIDAGGEKKDNTSETSNASPPNERTTISTDADGGKKNDTVKKTSETSNASPPNEQTTTSTDAAGGKMNDTVKNASETSDALQRNDQITMQRQEGLGRTPEDATA
ncbi:hypothetical protein AAC387_Pa04g2194 [Persea americana]